MNSIRSTSISLSPLTISSSRHLSHPAFLPRTLTIKRSFDGQFRELSLSCLNKKQGQREVYSTIQNHGIKGARAAVTSVSTGNKYSKIGAQSTGSLSASELLNGVEAAAKRGAEVVMDAVHKPRNIDYKGTANLVTDTDRSSELAIQEVVRGKFKDHLILGEEGGFTGDPTSEYLWCIDPLDGTTNFAHGYPSFAVSIGVLYRGKPAAASVVEFAGGPLCWVTRTFSACAGGGAFCNGQQVHVSSTNEIERSLLVTGFGYEHGEAWEENISLFKEFTHVSRGVRRLGAAAVDMCHVALGIVEAYWEYRLKPWDMAAGALIVEEAGGMVTCMDGSDFCVFDRSILVSNGTLHEKLLERIAPPTKKLQQNGLDISHWFKPQDYKSDV